jgi:hypothetical protein
MSGPDSAWTLTAWERGLQEGPLDRAVTLLAVVTGLPPGEAEVADVGSRDAVLTTVLGRITDGTLWGSLECAGCGERLDVPIDLSALPTTPWREPGELLEVEVAGARVLFRLPNTADLRTLRGDDAAAGRRQLLSRCVRAEGASTPEDIGEEVAAAVEAAMEAAAPGGAVTVEAACPACGTATVAALDVPVLLWAEVQSRAVALLRDVHVLATAYGWTEPDVLALSPARRAAYLEMAGG